MGMENLVFMQGEWVYRNITELGFRAGGSLYRPFMRDDVKCIYNSMIDDVQSVCSPDA